MVSMSSYTHCTFFYCAFTATLMGGSERNKYIEIKERKIKKLYNLSEIFFFINDNSNK